MVASNPSSKPGSRPGARVPWNLTPSGGRLAHYLLYVEKQPEVASDIHFGEIGIPPERFDDDRQATEDELSRLFSQIDSLLDHMFKHVKEMTQDEWAFHRRRVEAIRARIAEIEGE